MIVLLTLHSWWRWVVLLSLITAIARAARGLRVGAAFTPFDNTLRHWTATIAHVQLVLGMLYFFKNPAVTHFRILHITGMVTAVTLITIGSGLAKRRVGPRAKFATILRWFVAALIIIFLFIPWPWSPIRGLVRRTDISALREMCYIFKTHFPHILPLAQRPLLRIF